jgi:hypothetical protein
VDLLPDARDPQSGRLFSDIIAELPDQGIVRKGISGPLLFGV